MKLSNCEGVKEKNYKAPVPMAPLTMVVTPVDKVVANASTGGAIRSVPLPPVPMGRVVVPQLKIFGYAELKSATRNFRPDSLVGEGGFGRVYKGWIDENTMAPSKVGVGIPIAVKRCSPDSLQGLKEWKVSPPHLAFSFRSGKIFDLKLTSGGSISQHRGVV